MKALFFIFFLVLVSACSDEDFYAYTSENIGDVFISCRYIDNQLVYAPVFYAYSNQEIKQVIVYHENMPTNIVELDSLNELFTFAAIPQKNSFTSSYPKRGNYTFEISFINGSTDIVKDYLDSVAIEPVTINEISFNYTNNSITIDWEKIDLANGYKVWLVDANETIVYNSGFLSSTISKITINITSNGWYVETRPDKGNEEYNIIIEAFSFEPDASTLDIQATSINDNEKFNWGSNE